MTHTNTVLIVDDQPSARETLEAALFGRGYNLVFAKDGAEGLEQAARWLPDVIILDIMMPGMDGFEVCERLRSNPKLAEVPIIMLTSLDDSDSRVRGLEVGADDFLSKPFSRVELLARLKTITRLNRYRRLLMERTKFDWVVDQSKDGYLIIDDDDLIRYANSQARLYLGLPLSNETLPDETFLQLIRKQYHYEPHEAWLTWPEAVVSEQPLSRYLVRPETPSSNVFWLQVETLKLPPNPEDSWVVQLNDVTSQKILERDMRGFHVMVSHKLRTPMAGILGSLRLLAQSGNVLPPEKVASLSQLALDNADRLYESMGDVLEFLSAPFTVSSHVKFVMGQLENTVQEISQGLGIDNIQVSCPPDLAQTHLSLSQRAAEMTLWEILENSKKFHPQDAPTVTVTAAAQPNDAINLQISDDGEGLSPEQLAQVWVPYYQGDKYATGEIKGMGLGLAMVATLVREVGGECMAYNRTDQTGLVIELIIPTTKLTE